MGGPGSGRPKEPKRLAREALDSIDTKEIFANLHVWAMGRPVICPYCDKDTGARTADTVALQSNLELLNRKLGKVPQQVQLDITETIQLTGDQIEEVINRNRILSKVVILLQIVTNYPEEKAAQILAKACEIAQRALLPEGGLTNGSNRREEEDISEGIYEEEKV